VTDVGAAPSYLSDALDRPSDFAYTVGCDVNEDNGSTSPSQFIACTNYGKLDNNSPLHVPCSANDCDSMFPDTNYFIPDINIDLLHPQQFMTCNSPIADFSHSQSSCSLSPSDQLYLRNLHHPGPTNFSTPDQSWNQTRFLPSQDLRHCPNQVWVTFMQQLMMNGCHGLTC